MRVAVIGTGNVGRALATALSKAGHEVTVASTTPQGAADAAAAIGCIAAETSAEAAAGAEVIVLAIPLSAGEAVAADIRSQIEDKVVIDVTNSAKPDLTGLALAPSSAAEAFQAWLPEARVVKAFNTTFATRMADPMVDGQPVDGYVAGDDDDAKQVVMSLVEDVGFRPLDCGPLSNALVLEAMAYLNIWLNAANGWGWSSAWRLVR
jgi:8-hydroxy-5-deazaflavin:NADPH oxidoreductase